MASSRDKRLAEISSLCNLLFVWERRIKLRLNYCSPAQKFKYFLVLDFEAQCKSGEKIQPQEIIEFPCLMIDSENFQILDTFHQYIKVISKRSDESDRNVSVQPSRCATPSWRTSARSWPGSRRTWWRTAPPGYPHSRAFRHVYFKYFLLLWICINSHTCDSWSPNANFYWLVKIIVSENPHKLGHIISFISISQQCPIS